MQTQQPNDDRQQNPEKTVEQTHVHGKNPVVLRAGGNVSGNHIGHIGDIYAPQFPQVEYLTEKTQGISIHNYIPSIQKAAFWTFLGSLSSFVANIVTILGFFGVSGAIRTPSILWSLCFFLAVLTLSLMVVAICRFLQNGGFVRLFGNWGMIQDESQRLLLAKLCAQCPCGGRIMLRPPPKGSNEPCIGRCEKNPRQHTFTFDPITRLGVYLGTV